MKAIQFSNYGDSSVLELHQTDQPKAKAGEVLIKISATTVNPWDIKVRSGAMQKMVPISFPYTPGIDVAGTVEAVGEHVNRLKIGDKVFANPSSGSYAEYISVKEQIVSTIPNNVTLAEAAALTIPLTTAYSLLIEAGDLESGQKILIHGASGGVGTILIQMAKALGAYVIGTASGKGLELIKSLGADEVIDYKSQDFSQLVSDIDLIADLVGGETQTKSYPLIKRGGKLLSLVMPTSDELAKEYGITAKFVNSSPAYEKLAFGKALVEAGKIKVHIARTMPLEDAAAAQDLISSGGVNGKIVLEVS